MKLNFPTYFWWICAILILTEAQGQTPTPTTAIATSTATNTTVQGTKSTPTSAATPETTTTTTPKPKIDVMNSTICKQCSCDKLNKQLDCSRKNLTTWFSTAEWDILQNGDIIFETIRMESNNLSHIPQLPRYPVKNLYLSSNKIATIASGAFSNFSELTKLDLSRNELTSKILVPDVFKGTYAPPHYMPLENMRELNLGKNKLHNLDGDLFEHLPKLETLILSENIFQVIDHLSVTALAGLTSLKTLDMSYMELKELPDTLLHGPRDLEVLLLSGNLFDKLPKGLELAINLKKLVLDDNLMTEFVNETNLQYLSISNMPDLEKIGKGSLSNLQNLTELVASDNPKLSYIDANAFAKSTSNPEIFDYPPLEKLYLSHNNLTQLDRSLVQRWDKINIIDLQYNPWVCNCDNHWLIHTLMSQINTTNPILAKNVKCNLPTEWKNTQLMTLNSEHKILVCNFRSSVSPANDGMILLSLLLGILVGIPITLGGLVLYRRGFFRFFRINTASDGLAVYNRASLSDDGHI